MLNVSSLHFLVAAAIMPLYYLGIIMTLIAVGLTLRQLEVRSILHSLLNDKHEQG